MTQFKILLLDDDVDMHALMKLCLPENVECFSVAKIEKAKEELSRQKFEIILVDLRLENESGFDFIQYLNKLEFLSLPSVLVITSSDSEDDEVKSHEADIMEYIRKPISVKTMRSRLEKHLRRFSKKGNILKIGPVEINEHKMEVKILIDSELKSIPMTTKEYRLLLKLLETPGQIISREELFVEVWTGNPDTQTRTIDMHISSLRKKIPPFEKALSSIRGHGYCFSVDKVFL
jgi:two-component system alkaline phosphatase synthesis response regulator PhoP